MDSGSAARSTASESWSSGLSCGYIFKMMTSHAQCSVEKHVFTSGSDPRILRRQALPPSLQGLVSNAAASRTS